MPQKNHHNFHLQIYVKGHNNPTNLNFKFLVTHVDSSPYAIYHGISGSPVSCIAISHLRLGRIGSSSAAKFIAAIDFWQHPVGHFARIIPPVTPTHNGG